MSKHIRRTCLKSVAVEVREYCIDLDAYISKKRKRKTKRPCKCKMLS